MRGDQSCCLFIAFGEGLPDSWSQASECEGSVNCVDGFSCLPSVVTWTLNPRRLAVEDCHGQRGVKLAPAQAVVLNGGDGIELGSTFTIDFGVQAPLPDGDLCQGLTLTVRREHFLANEDHKNLSVAVESQAEMSPNKVTTSAKIGDKIFLSHDYAKHSDAAKGPMERGQIGTVCAKDPNRIV